MEILFVSTWPLTTPDVYFVIIVKLSSYQKRWVTWWLKSLQKIMVKRSLNIESGFDTSKKETLKY